jgi:hypothetical protein
MVLATLSSERVGAPTTTGALPELSFASTRDEETSNAMTARREELRRSMIMAAIAFLAYGAWAAYANWDHGAAAYVPSALTQGVISFLVTAFLTLGMEAVFRRMRPGWARFGVTALGPQTGVAIATATAHYAVGTPEILTTMAPSLILGTLFCALYTAGLVARARASANVRGRAT